MPLYIGIRFPWRKGATTLPDTITDGDVIRQSILEIVQTAPLEREMRPEFGIHLQDIIFENNDMVTAELTRVKIATAIERDEPRVIIQSITVEPRSTSKGEEMVITVRYIIRATQQSDAAEVSLRKPG